MKIGILGGTFNPIHNGHIFIAKKAMELMHLDKMIFLVAGEPPHKGVAENTSRFARNEMVKLAISDVDGISSSDFEIFSIKKDYTYKTVELLSKEYPLDEFYFIIGEDSLFAFETWMHPEIITKYVTIVSFKRNVKYDQGVRVEDAYHSSPEEKAKELSEKYQGNFLTLSTEELPYSSSEIRDILLKREDIDDFPDSLHEMLPDKVLDFICERRLYENFALIRGSERTFDFDGITETLKGVLKKKRFIHTLGVADTCAALAERYCLNEEIARAAGLLHDNAKNIPTESYFEICAENDIDITDAEKKAPYLLHAKVGAFLAKAKYNVVDPGIIHAISVHTTGEPAMDVLSEILFVSDYIEPNRNKAKNLAEIREAAFYDLNLATYMILSDTLDYLRETKAEIDDKTEETYKYYKKLVDGKRTLY